MRQRHDARIHIGALISEAARHHDELECGGPGQVIPSSFAKLAPLTASHRNQ
jgi:hypothetical protein